MRTPVIAVCAALLAAVTGCASAAAAARPVVHRAAKPPALTSTQAREMCAGLRTGLSARSLDHQYRAEVAIAWNLLQTATGPQADHAVISAAAAYCPQFTLPMLPSFDLTPAAFSQP